MTALEVANIEQYGDPVVFVQNALERAKTWLTEALEHGDIDAIVELKSQAEAIRAYTTQKQLGKDAELAATEIVRRAERGIGVAIRRGQETGTVAGRGASTGPRTDYVRQGRVVRVNPADNRSMLPRPTDFATADELSANGTGIYAITDDVSDYEFEQAIEDAKAERNLSRANVVRKIKGDDAPSKKGKTVITVEPRPAPPPRYGGGRRKHVEAITNACHSLAGLVIAFEDVAELDSSVTKEEAARLMGDLSHQLRAFRHLKQLLQERIAS